MKSRIVLLFLAAAALAYPLPNARAGAIRFLGHKVKGETRDMAQPVASGGKVAIGTVDAAKDTTVGAVGTGTNAVASSARTTGHAVKKGTLTAKDGVVGAPSTVAEGTKTMAQKVWKTVY
jgi:hypothetical protein